MQPGSPSRRVLPRLLGAPALAAPALACLLVLASCRSVERFDAPERSLLTSAQPLSVTLSPELRGLRSRSGNFDRTVFKVGNVLRRLFRGGDGHAFLSLLAAEIEVTGGLSGPWEGRYRLALALQLGGEFHLIQVEGSGESATAPREAGKLAVEFGVEQVYERLFLLLGPAQDSP